MTVYISLLFNEILIKILPQYFVQHSNGSFLGEKKSWLRKFLKYLRGYAFPTDQRREVWFIISKNYEEMLAGFLKLLIQVNILYTVILLMWFLTQEDIFRERNIEGIKILNGRRGNGKHLYLIGSV